jgi:hypothetical protein
MKATQVSEEKRRLIEAAAEKGFKISGKQIDRWRADHLLAPPGTHWRGRGKGVTRPAAPGTEQQLIALCECLERNRSLDGAALRLWLDGHPVPIERLRRALRQFTPNIGEVATYTPDRLSTEVEAMGERVIGRKGASARAKAMARSGTLQELANSLISVGLGRSLAEDQARSMASTFEQFAGLDRARSDHWEGQQPWLTGDSTAAMLEAATFIQDIRPELADAPEEELLQARVAFLNWEKLQRFAKLLQTIYGEGVFGFAFLAKSPLGEPTLDGTLYLGFIAIARKVPDLIEKTSEMVKNVDAAMEALSKKLLDAAT